MKINQINNTNFQAGIKVNTKDNKSVKYLYNNVMDITREHCIPGNFRTNEITLPRVTNEIMAQLRKLGIAFEELN